jgi:murein DD-endopeptidase MepM/ murein hydrolase activator NlpD
MSRIDLLIGTRRRLAALLALLGLVLIGAVVWAANSDPPELFLETRERLRAGERFEVLVSSSKPVTFTLRYGGRLIEEVALELRTELSALPGRQPLTIEAVDRSGQRAQLVREIEGLWPLRPRLEAPSALVVGDPLVVFIAFEPPPSGVAPVRLGELQLSLDGETLPLLERPEGWVSLSGVPLEAEPRRAGLALRYREEFGDIVEQRFSLELLPNPRPVDLVPLSGSTLSLITPEARQEEAAAYAAALALVPPEPRWEEPFLLPVEGRLTSPFGDPRRFVPGGPVSYHLGTDIAAPEGTPVVATNDGVVRIADFYQIKGGWVVLDHGHGVSSHHFHLARIDVVVGDVLSRGAVIGAVGTTGVSTGPHLHWEMRVDGVPTHPLQWVGRRYPLVSEPR